MNQTEQLAAALRDMLSGWRYIRSSHGDLYGVGWDRAQGNAEATLAVYDAAKALADEQHAAREQLHAAAPALLTQLRSAVSWVSRLSDWEGADDPPVEEWMAAITAAEGSAK